MLHREDFTHERVESLAREAQAQGGFKFWTHEERNVDRARILHRLPAGSDLWVFGYGSLIWNPAFHFLEHQKARIYGYHRRFCLWLTLGRGSPNLPGLMLALDHGGSCWGTAYRIAADKVATETDILWMREMISPSYHSSWVRLRIGEKRQNAVTFIINRANPRYAGRLNDAQTIYHLARAHGRLGSSRDYLEHTVNALREQGIPDQHLERLYAGVKAHGREPSEELS